MNRRHQNFDSGEKNVFENKVNSDYIYGFTDNYIKTKVKFNKDLVVKGLGVSGEFVDADQLKRIASLPTKDQAISMLMALMLAPTEKLVRTLNEVPTKLTRVVAAVRDQKQ